MKNRKCIITKLWKDRSNLQRPRDCVALRPLHATSYFTGKKFQRIGTTWKALFLMNLSWTSLIIGTCTRLILYKCQLSNWHMGRRYEPCMPFHTCTYEQINIDSSHFKPIFPSRLIDPNKSYS